MGGLNWVGRWRSGIKAKRRMSWIIYFVFLVLFETIADVFAKQWEQRKNISLAVAAQAAYLVGNLFWLVALSKGVGLAKGGVLFSVTVAITAIGVGAFFGEKISGLEAFGMMLAVIGIACLSWTD